MIELIVIADDFTGALDTSVQFAKRGISTGVVCRRTFEPDKCADGVRVVCIDAETRHLKPDEAYETVFAIAKAAFNSGIRMIYKKVDSTLRGQIGSEIAGALDAAKGENLAFAPAFPATGRTTVDGRQLLNGRPIHESVFAMDPFEPIIRSDIAGIIKSQRSIDTQNVPINQSPVKMTGGVEIYDAATDDDLDRLAGTIVRRGYRLAAGSAGLAWALGGKMAPDHTVRPVLEKKSGFLAVCGSLNPISARQIKTAEQNGFIKLEFPEWLIEGRARENPGEYEALLNEVSMLIGSGKRVILTVAGCGCEACAVGDMVAARELVARSIGEFVKEWYLRESDCALVIVGGDTLHAFVKCLGIDAELRPAFELEPGVVLSIIQVNAGTIQIVSKAGGFGGDDVYMRIAKAVMTEKTVVKEGVHS
ncbi:MAG: four-carbon acid sugar kinase family protein [Clostridia bacterium]|nr:four-carbon acid sugar kinase family protein [Clostridia bacterium]